MDKTIRKMAGIACLIAMIIILQFIGNAITLPGGLSINLSLIPIIVGAIIYGPWAGLLLGLVCGGIICASPSTQFFMSTNAWATIVICLVKTGVAGLVAGLFSIWLKNKPKAMLIVCSIIVPIINTGLFVGGVYLFFNGYDGFVNTVITIVLLFNFLIELGLDLLLSPAIYYVINVVKTKILKQE